MTSADPAKTESAPFDVVVIGTCTVNGLRAQWWPKDPVRQRLAAARAKINRRKPLRFRRP
jgi:hypothetical protein